ncbi:alpha-1B adrenergic receptor-like [Dendronephthya gigantea]|uniref:alpha-1B adrenergic receptor-like n=1 Tax=Dendronephthya gigantea TaxID=151771 RepID=UPI00106BAEFF|nr:alpha-1B adrenergic receptor-like [Dendronephthya gigantea]
MTGKSSLEDGMIKQDFRQLELYFLLLISLSQCIIGFTANSLGLVTIAFTKRLNRVPSNLLIFNLGFSDLLTCAVFFPFHIYALLQDSLGETVRFYYHALCLFHVFSNGNAILAITVDRFIAVSYSLRYRAFVTKRRTFQAIFMSWIMPLSFSMAFFTSLQKDTPECSEFALRVYMISSLVIVLVLYLVVYMAARKQRQKIRAMGSTTTSTRNTQMKTRVPVWRSTANTFLLVFFYFLTYLLILGYDFRFSLNSEPKYTVVSERVYAWVLSFQFFNSCIDPFLYVFRSRHFKMALIRLLPRVLRRMRTNNLHASARSVDPLSRFHSHCEIED